MQGTVDEQKILSSKEVVDELTTLLGLMHAGLQGTMGRYGLQPSYAIGLAQIEGTVPMKELSQKLRCDPSFVTAIADVLEEKGLARRETDPDDRRAKNLVLTRKGIAMQRKLQREFYDDLPGIRKLDGEERMAFVDLLRKMIAAENEQSTG